jgi:hypothetical protein
MVLATFAETKVARRPGRNPGIYHTGTPWSVRSMWVEAGLFLFRPQQKLIGITLDMGAENPDGFPPTTWENDRGGNVNLREESGHAFAILRVGYTRISMCDVEPSKRGRGSSVDSSCEFRCFCLRRR